MDLAFTCPTCSWIFVTEVQVPVPGHPDWLLGRRCMGVGERVPCVDVRPDWKRGPPGMEATNAASDLWGLATHDLGHPGTMA